MKNKKEFFGVLISVLVCVFIAVFAVYATTTVGDSITVGTDLTVTGNDITFGNLGEIDNPELDLILVTETLFSVAGNASVSGDFNVIGNSTFAHASVSDDLTIGSDDISFIGGVASISSTLWVGGTFTGTGASLSDGLTVSDRADFDNVVSVSNEGLLLDNGATITVGVTSQSGTTCSTANIGSLYINTAAGNISICDATSDWSLIHED